MVHADIPGIMGTRMDGIIFRTATSGRHDLAAHSEEAAASFAVAPSVPERTGSGEASAI